MTLPPQRIAKLLARAGVASRREIERMIADGRVAQNGAPVETPATLLPSLEGVTVDGQPVAAAEPARLFVFHKPGGVLTAERDFSGRPTIYDRLPAGLPRLVPVGRLDLNTEGLLLLTTDGGLKRRLELPSTGVERAYRARAYGQVSQPQLEALIDGVEVEGVRYGSIDANIERRTGANVWIELVLTEGKNREVRRVLEYLGLTVSRLIRTRYGPFVLGDLPVGAIGEVGTRDLDIFLDQLEQRRRPDRAIMVAPLGPVSRTPRSSRARSEAASAGRRPAGASTPVTAPGADTGSPTPSKPPRAPRPLAQPAVSSPARTETEQTQRPARPPQRKTGWAKPKPKPRPPGKRR